MREYELTYLISDNVPETDLNKVTGKVGGYVTSCDGKVLKEEIWGRRKLAYPIKKQEFATYVTINFELPAEKAHEFEHNIKLTSKIVRHLMIVKSFGQETLTLTAEDIAGTAEIEKVVGGEKSFEAVEGETEDSKDLQAVRGSEEKEEEVGSEMTEVQGPADEKEVTVGETAAEEEKAEKTTEVIEEPKTKKSEKKPAAKKEKKDNEADRLKKLDQELDDILGEDL